MGSHQNEPLRFRCLRCDGDALDAVFYSLSAQEIRIPATQALSSPIVRLRLPACDFIALQSLIGEGGDL